MKSFIPALITALFLTGCSPKENPTANQAPTRLAAGLGKPPEYFTDLYGAPKSEKHVADFSFSLPSYPSTIKLHCPLIIQQFESGKLGATVVYMETDRQAIWVDYRLADTWTDEQINAALTAYGSDWKKVDENIMTFMMQNVAPHTYHNSSGCLAYKPVGNDLFVYAPQLHAYLRNQVEEVERQKKAVPKF